jgi:hypothetical protein
MKKRLFVLSDKLNLLLDVGMTPAPTQLAQGVATIGTIAFAENPQ